MTEVMVVADFFKEDVTGGAELSLEALMRDAPKEIVFHKIHAKKLNAEEVLENKNKVWIIGNAVSMAPTVKALFCKLKINYHIIEFDYKFCNFRSFKKHKLLEGEECNCSETTVGKLSIAFLLYATTRWFMSDKQKEIHIQKINKLKGKRNYTLSSVFTKGDLKFIQNLSENEKTDEYFILNTQNWIKGKDNCVEYAKKNGLKYKLVGDLPYHELLINMSTKKGLIYKPNDNDTCPRLVIESYLLGGEQHLNEHVQHTPEDWFKGTKEECFEYLNKRTDFFWGKVIKNEKV